jgi:hypothetical protein
MLHLDVAASIIDSNNGGSAHTWTAFGNAQLSGLDAKLGSGALLCDGTGDYISTPDHLDFDVGSEPFTVDGWFNCVATTGSQIELAGQSDSGATAGSTSIRMERSSTNKMHCWVFIAGTGYAVQSSTSFSGTLNTGWHHLAFVRVGDVIRLYIDGVQEGGDTALPALGVVQNSSNAWSVGRLGEYATAPWNGSIDEFRLSVGIARWTTNFIPPTRPYSIPAPVSSVTARYDRTNVVDVDVGALPTDLLPPPWRVRIGYQRNWTPGQTDLAGTVSEERRSFVAEEVRFAAAEDNDIRLNFPPGHELIIEDTFFRDEIDAIAEAERRLALYGTPRTLYTFRLCEPLFVHDLGQVVFLQFEDRFDLDVGKPLRIVKIAEDDREGVELTGFG